MKGGGAHDDDNYLIVKLGTSFSEISIFQLGSWGEKLAPSGLFVCDTVERYNWGNCQVASIIS